MSLNLSLLYEKKLGGGNKNVIYPFIINGVENIQISENVGIGIGATIYTRNAKLVIKTNVMIGPNITIITGDYKYILGRWADSVKDEEKETCYNQDVIIEDVWVGSNVTRLKGVTIGKSSIITAGSLVIKDVPPYSIVGGLSTNNIEKSGQRKNAIFKKKLF